MSVYVDLRARILFGDYAPGAPLTIQGLIKDTGAGMTPVREAIRRLVAEGAVSMRDNRRLEVPLLTGADIDELRFMRAHLEPELARRAAPRVSAKQIAALRQIDAELDAAIQRGDIEAYLRLNHAFHHTLYAAAGAPILLQTVERLWLRFGPSLRVVCARFGALDLPDQHAKILTALDVGDGAAAAHAMRADVLQGLDHIAEANSPIDEQ